MTELLIFNTLNNTRDLGGMVTSDGRPVKSGKLIRSGHLANVDEEDKERIKDLVGVIIDLRSDFEKNETAALEIEGVDIVKLPIKEDLTAGITRDGMSDQELFTMYLTKPKEAREYMSNMYRSFLDDFDVSRYAEFMRYILEGSEKAILWHCTVGKDRAGIGALIIEEILGVAREDIIEDYLKTNDYIKESIEKLTVYIKTTAGVDDDVDLEALDYLLGAKREYVEAYYDEVEKKYGSFDNFVLKGLKLSDRDVKIIKEMYLEK